MQRPLEQRFYRRLLDLAARIHHHHAISSLGDDAEIVRDDDQRHTGGRLQLFHQLQDLRLDGDVERGRRLVGDQNFRFAGDCDCDHHALAHAAGQLMRIVVQPAFGVGNSDTLQQRDGALERVAV